MGPPETKTWKFPQGDDSWEVEMDEFAEDIRNKRAPQPNLQDALASLKIVEKIYQRSR